MNKEVMKEKCTVLNEKRAVQDEKALSLDSIRNGELSNQTQKEEKTVDFLFDIPHNRSTNGPGTLILL